MSRTAVRHPKMINWKYVLGRRGQAQCNLQEKRKTEGQAPEDVARPDSRENKDELRKEKTKIVILVQARADFVNRGKLNGPNFVGKNGKITARQIQSWILIREEEEDKNATPPKEKVHKRRWDRALKQTHITQNWSWYNQTRARWKPPNCRRRQRYCT